MHRRAVIGNLLITSLGMRVSSAQPVGKVHRIGILDLGKSSDIGPLRTSLLRGLRDLGYIQGVHFIVEARGSEGVTEHLPDLAAELVRLQVDVIVAAGPTLSALKGQTSTIPVVMAASGDPVAEGLVRSLAYPGSNFTGLSSQSVDTTGKLLQLLKELVPGTGLTAVVWDRGTRPNWQAAQTAAKELGWKLLSLEIKTAEDIEPTFKAAVAAGVDTLLVFAPAILFQRAARVVELAAESRLPAMYHHRRFVEVGGLISYSADLHEIWRDAATFVDKILKGANPAELPVEQPTEFELVINLRTARALGLNVPAVLLVQAKDLIE